MRLIDYLWLQLLERKANERFEQQDCGNPNRRKPVRRKRKAARRKRCDASVKKLVYIDKHGKRRTRASRCRRWALEGKARCMLHGGKSTGPRTAEGKAKVVAAMVAGRRKWIERLKAEGEKVPGGRKSGRGWLTEPTRRRAAEVANRLGFTLPPDVPIAILRRLDRLARLQQNHEGS